MPQICDFFDKNGVDTPAGFLLNKLNVTEADALSQLREAYRGTGIEVRFYPECISVMRWQIGSNGDGEHFTVFAYGSNPSRLMECLTERCRAQAMLSRSRPT